ncbi:kinase-like domain-containing protein [Mucidula mucida]|nr:kinase-like domain-containing protein [Mucidula mucida]
MYPHLLLTSMADEYEKTWTLHYEFLHDQGYQLRDKFKPGWQPTWKTPLEREYDPNGPSTFNPSTIVDATKISDNKPVMLKKILTTGPDQELTIALYLTSLLEHSENHAVPILDVLQSPHSEDVKLVVMPRLRLFSDPPFDTVGEFIDAFRQIFEGVEFLHKHFIAHRDLHGGNIMLDYTRLYPHGFHPTLEFMTLDFKGFAKHTTRTRCWPRYYLIDFGRSRRYSPDAVPFEVTVPPLNSNRKTLLPEQGGNTPRRYNPFPVDIFRLGHMLTSHCAVDTFPPLQFVLPLAQEMMAQDPSSRPTITDVRRRFANLCRCLTKEQLRLPGSPDSDDIMQRIRRLRHILTWTAPLPRDKDFNSGRFALDDTHRPFYTSVPSDSTDV